MMYETEADRAVEAEIISVCALAWRCAWRRMPPKYALDCCFLKEGKVAAFAEVRNRATWEFSELDRVGGYMVSLLKIERCQSLCRTAGIPFLLIVKLKGGVFYADLTDLDVAADAVLGFFDGNREPRREDDKEPVVYLPMRLFSPVSSAARGTAA